MVNLGLLTVNPTLVPLIVPFTTIIKVSHPSPSTPQTSSRPLHSQDHSTPQTTPLPRPLPRPLHSPTTPQTTPLPKPLNSLDHSLDHSSDHSPDHSTSQTTSFPRPLPRPLHSPDHSTPQTTPLPGPLHSPDHSTPRTTPLPRPHPRPLPRSLPRPLPSPDHSPDHSTPQTIPLPRPLHSPRERRQTKQPQDYKKSYTAKVNCAGCLTDWGLQYSGETSVHWQIQPWCQNETLDLVCNESDSCTTHPEVQAEMFPPYYSVLHISSVERAMFNSSVLTCSMTRLNGSDISVNASCLIDLFCMYLVFVQCVTNILIISQ